MNQEDQQQLTAVPTTLVETPAWVTWKHEAREMDGKPTKVPYQANHDGKRASSTDQSTWGTFTDAVAAARRTGADGVGFALHAGSGLAACDLDNAIDVTTGEVAPWAQAWIDCFDSYTEVSPSGRGLHIFIKATLPGNKGIATSFGDGGGLFNSGKYLTVSGRHFPGTPRTIEDRQAVVDAIVAERAAAKPTARVAMGKGHDGLSDEEVLRLARSAKNRAKFCTLFDGGDWESVTNEDGTQRYESQSNADEALLSMLCFYTRDEDQLDRLFSLSALAKRDKWQERADYRAASITAALRVTEDSEVYTGGIVTAPACAPTEATPAGNAKPRVGRLLSTIAPEGVEWLWPGYMPFGKLTVLDGDPGLGKSTLAFDIAARLTRGLAMPDGTPTKVAGVVLLTAEDGIADTVVPRMLAAGADLSRVIDASATDGEMDLADISNLGWLRDNIAEVGARLVIIDPIMAFLGKKVDSNNDQDIRRALGPLAKLAEEMGAAIVLVRHLNKGQGRSPIYRGGGSIGIIGAARSGLLVAKHPQDPSRRVLTSVKSNLGPPPPSVAFCPQTVEGTSRISWEGRVTYTAEELLNPPTEAQERPQGAREEALAFLRTNLAEGPMYSTELQTCAEKLGIAERTLRRAMAELGVESWKESGVQRGRNLTGLPGQRAVYFASVAAVHENSPTYITTVANSGITFPNRVILTLPSDEGGRVENGPVASTLPTLPTLPVGRSGNVGDAPAPQGRRQTTGRGDTLEARLAYASEVVLDEWIADHVVHDYDDVTGEDRTIYH